MASALALASFEATLRLVDDVNAAATTDHAVVAVTLHQRFQRVLDLHNHKPLLATFATHRLPQTNRRALLRALKTEGRYMTMATPIVKPDGQLRPESLTE